MKKIITSVLLLTSMLAIADDNDECKYEALIITQSNVPGLDVGTLFSKSRDGFVNVPLNHICCGISPDYQCVTNKFWLSCENIIFSGFMQNGKIVFKPNKEQALVLNSIQLNYAIHFEAVFLSKDDWEEQLCAIAAGGTWMSRREYQEWKLQRGYEK